MTEELLNTEMDGIPGTAQIRKIATKLSPQELLELSAKLAKEGYDKKLFAVLSRTYEERKGFSFAPVSGIETLLNDIIESQMPAELKMQCFTSFEIAPEALPDETTIDEWLATCNPKRMNIAGFFLAAYHLGKENYERLLENHAMFAAYVKAASLSDMIALYEMVMTLREKEYVTGAIRMLYNEKHKFKYQTAEEKKAIYQLTKKAFAEKQVFFTTKLMYCLAFKVPREELPRGKELYETIKISINYEERATLEFIREYNLDFNTSDSAMCRYYLANKKTPREKNLVAKFANHVVRVEDEVEKSKLLHFAFKRGGYFRMYAGIMQDGGKVDPVKMQKFHYKEEDVVWVKTLAGVEK
ncbi:MAG: hypothetical protein MJ105_00430 [Lachnospiraceae bacterium]|nr:hypothetical protein [Lachnospiraceae bacterium]